MASAYLGRALEPVPFQGRAPGLRPFGGSYLPTHGRRPRGAAAPPLELMVMPDRGVEAILDAIENARERVLLKLFALEETSVVDAILAAHQRGVQVRVLLNPRRSDGSRSNDDSFARLHSAGVPVSWSQQDQMISHEKSMVVDGAAYICTFNFSPRFFRKSRGYAIITRRPEEVEEIVTCFACDWDRSPFRPSGHLLWSGGHGRQQIAELIDGARWTLDIQHPKLLDISILDRLILALTRGVRLRFMGSGQKGVNLEDLLENAASLRILQRAGASVHRLKKPRVHAKLLIADRKLAQVGSMNLARHCFETRRELGILVTEGPVIEQLHEVFERDWANSLPWIPPDPLTMPYLERGWNYAAPRYPGGDSIFTLQS